MPTETIRRTIFMRCGYLLIAERRKDSGGVKSVVEKLAADLQSEVPGMRDFSAQNLCYMCQLYLTHDENPKLPTTG